MISDAASKWESRGSASRARAPSVPGCLKWTGIQPLTARAVWVCWDRDNCLSPPIVKEEKSTSETLEMRHDARAK